MEIIKRNNPRRKAPALLTVIEQMNRGRFFMLKLSWAAMYTASDPLQVMMGTTSMKSFTELLRLFLQGYLFPSVVGLQFDLGIRYESVIYNENSVNCIGLRLSHNLSFKKRDREQAFVPDYSIKVSALYRFDSSLLVVRF